MKTITRHINDPNGGFFYDAVHPDEYRNLKKKWQEGNSQERKDALIGLLALLEADRWIKFRAKEIKNKQNEILLEGIQQYKNDIKESHD